MRHGLTTYTSGRRVMPLIVCVLCAVAVSGCHWDMWDQDRFEPLEAGALFGPGESSSRVYVTGTVPYGDTRHENTHFYEGRVDGVLVTELPSEIELNHALLERGRDRFNIFCIVCHGAVGNGDGMVVQRGFPQPPSYHDPRLREVEIGYFFDVMTNGFGRMFPYASRIPPEDRWAIAAYIRVLQLSQGVSVKFQGLVPEGVLNAARNASSTDSQVEEQTNAEH